MTREEAIERLKLMKQEWDKHIYDLGNAVALKMAIKALEQGPKIGHWEEIPHGHHFYYDSELETAELRCSCCKEIVEWDIELLHKPYYCENCGARMEKEVKE